MFNPKAFENSRADGVGVLEIVETGESPRRFVPLRRTEVRGTIVGPLAELTLTQTYRYDRSECDAVLEAVYRFPLPGDAAVTGVTARFGEVEIIAELQERAKAEQGYEEAKAKGDQAALVTRESPDVFTLRLAGLAPDQAITVQTFFVQLARADGAGWSLRIPLTTAPRYTRSDESNSRHAKGQPLMLLRDPGHRFALDLALPVGSEASSPTHPLRQTPFEGGTRLQLEAGEVIPDRDCVLHWQPPQEADRPTFHVTTHAEPGAEHLYFLGLLAPPKRKPREAITREIILLVDHSGSMEGPKWEAADWAVKRFLGDLTEKDSFALGLFHTSTKWFSKQPQPADVKTVVKAIAFLEANKDSGGTELGVALELALGQRRQSGEVARHILLITDAEVSDEGRILRLADAEAGEPARRRIDVLCIDAAPNSFLARELAERGGGVAKFLTSDPDEGDIATALDDILADWSQPVATGLRLGVNRDGIESAGNAVKANAIDLGDLPAGRSVWVAGRLPKGDAGELTFRVMTSADREVGTCRVESVGSRPALKPLFGAKRVLGLEFLMNAGYQGNEFTDQLVRLGYDPAEVLAETPKKKSKVYAENAREEATAGLRRLLVRESLRYGLACAETAFLAVRTEAGKKVEATTLIPNALPHGWNEGFAAGGGGSVMSCMLSAPVVYHAIPPAGLSQPGDVDSMDCMLADFSALSAPPPKGGSGVRGFFSKIAKRKATPVAAAPAQIQSKKADQGTMIFLGIPTFKNGEAILFNSVGNQELPPDGTLHRLILEYPDGEPDASALDSGLEIRIFVDDLAQPAARVKLIDLLKQGGERPLNLRRRSGQTVRIVLIDPVGVWQGSAYRLKLSLRVS